MKLKGPNLEAVLCLSASAVLIVASSKQVHLSLLNTGSEPSQWRGVSDLLSHVLVGYGIFFLGLALLSYILSLRGTTLVATIVNPSRQPLADLGQAVFSSIRDSFTSRHDVAWLVAALAVGLVIRGYFLAQPMRHDEARTFFEFVHQGPFFLFYYSKPNNHVLHTLLVKLSTLIWGAHPASIRLPAFLFGMASVPLAFCLCRKLMPERSGILASVAGAVAPFMVLFSTNARGYSLLIFLNLALAFLGIHVVERPSFLGWALVSLTAALGMMTMPSMLFAIAGLYLWFICLLLCQRKTFSATLREFLIPCGIMTFAFTLILYLPSIVTSGGMRSIAANLDIRPISWDRFFHQLSPYVQTVFSYFFRGVSRSRVFIGLTLLMAGIFGAAIRRNWAPLFLFPSMLVGAVVLLVFKHSTPPARIWIYLIPFGFVLMDAGLTYLTEKLPRGLQILLPLLLVTLGSLYAVSLMSTNAIAERPETGPFREAPFVVRYLEPLMNSDDIVHVGRPGSWVVRFYFWYYGLPEEQWVTRPKPRQEFFIVKKSRYTVSDLTEKPVVKVLDFGDAALYQLLHPEEVRTEEKMERTDKRLLLVVTKVPPRAARKPQHDEEED